MTGTVSRRAGGDWEYRYDIGPDPLSGHRRRRSKSGFSTKKAASQALREALTAADRGRAVRGSRRTIEDFLLEWHAAIEPSVRPTTWVNYRDYMRAYVLPHVGSTAIQDLTPVRLNLLYAHLLREGRKRGPGGLAPKTVQNVHRMLHRALRDAVKWDVVPRNVAEDALTPKARRPQLQTWSPEQLGAFVRHVQGDRFFALWLLVATTGLRRGELAGLRESDMDIRHNSISPTRPRVVVAGRARESDAKTISGERRLALDPETIAGLSAYLDTRRAERRLLGSQVGPQAGLLFVWPSGKPLHPDTITALFHKHCAAAGLPRIRLHDVRHSYATAALKAGVPPKVISERLGHSSVAFTMHVYAHVIPGMDEAAATKVAALILGLDANGATDGRILGRIEDETAEKQDWPGTKSQASDGSGGRI